MAEPEDLPIISEGDLRSNRKIAEKRASEMSMVEYQHLRKELKKDPFLLGYGVLGYNKLSPNLHGHLAKWMNDTLEDRFRLVLLPRGHYKTTQFTITDTIRIILPDDTNNYPWPYVLGPEGRVLILHETAEQASKILIPIISHFTSNPLLMALYPECIPDLRKHRVNKHELELPRIGKWPEPTIDTMGVGGKSQGRHYNFIKADDLIGDKARDSRAEMDAAKEWYDNIESFFSDFVRDHLDLTGTRWAVDDLYRHVIDKYGPQLVKYIRPAEELNPKTDLLEPIFPEAFTTDSFVRIKKNKKIWSAQYANDPETTESKFERKWLRFYERRKDGFIGLPADPIAGVPAKTFHPQSCDLVILCDPAMSGKSGTLVTGQSVSKDIIVLEAVKDELAPPALCELIFKWVRQYKPRTVAIEKVLFSGLFEHWFKAEMILRGIRFHITPIETQGKAKDARVMGLANYFAAGKIWFHPTQVDLIQEYKEFGGTNDYHMLDALAYGPRVWRVPMDSGKWNDIRAAEQRILAQRDHYTGY